MKRDYLIILCIGALSFSFSLAVRAARAGQQGATPLEIGKPLERELRSNEADNVAITFKPGQFFHIGVAGGGMIATLFAPNGSKLVELNTEGQEELAIRWISEAEGAHRLEVRLAAGAPSPARYKVRFVAQRAASEAERNDFPAIKLMAQANELYKQNKPAEALPLAIEALEISRKVLGSRSPNLIGILGFLGETSLAAADYSKAEVYYRQLLMLLQTLMQQAPTEAARQQIELEVASAHYNFGLSTYKRLRGRGQKSFEDALVIWEARLPPNHSNISLALDKLADIAEQNPFENEALYPRLLASQEKALGQEHPNVAKLLTILAESDRRKNNYAQAEARLRRALQIQQKAYGANHHEVAILCHALAALWLTQEKYEDAERELQRALTIYEKSPDYQLPHYLPATLYQLATRHFVRGEYAKSELLYDQALRVFQKILGPRHTDVSQVQQMLADIYARKGDPDKAREFRQLAQQSAPPVNTPVRPPVAQSPNPGKFPMVIAPSENGPSENANVAKPSPPPRTAADRAPINLKKLHESVLLSLTQGDRAQAEEYFQQELSILGARKDSGASVTLGEYAIDYYNRGEYDKAVQAQSLGLQIMDKTLDPSHPAVTSALRLLAQMQIIKGDQEGAIAAISRASQASERQLARNVVTGSERQKMLYLNLFAAETSEIISLHAQYAPNSANGLRLALTTLLQRKGRGLSLGSEAMNALRRRANQQDQLLLDRLIKMRAQLASLALGITQTPNAEEKQAQLSAQLEKLEAEISARLIETTSQSLAVTLKDVQALIPPDAALIEFARYTTAAYRVNETPTPSYAVYVLTAQDEPQWIDLGAAEPIDRLVTQLRAGLRDKQSTDAKTRARALDEKTMQPVRRLLKQKRHLLLSPDGALNLVPFAALVDERNRYLVEQYSFTYLTSGRDLLRLQNRPPAGTGTVIIANPDFGGEQARGESRAAATAGIDFSRAYFTPLPGTAEEAQSLQSVLPQPTVLTQSQATETALKQIAAPAILHIATHGFFLEDATAPPDAAGARLLLQQAPPKEMASSTAQQQNPLLRSGLGLAGANLRKSGDDDGILTAFEASTLNLWGTQLVVLSACDTGVGEVKNGEGVYGLRRAFALAGAETQVMSLWPVSDKGTSELMIAYYKALQAKQGRSEALRLVQLQMLKSQQRQHPYYWASFIVSGEWANLEGKR